MTVENIENVDNVEIKDQETISKIESLNKLTPKTEEAKVETQQTEELVWEDTGDVRTDTIGKLSYSGGLKPETLIEDLLETGEFSQEKVQKLEAKHGKEVTALLLDKVKELHTENVARIEAENSAIYSIVANTLGVDSSLGQQGFIEASEYVRNNVDATIVNELGQLLEMGGSAAKLAAKEIADIYKASTPQAKISVKPELEKGNAGSKESFEYISRLDWVAQRNKILSSNRGNENHPDIIKLDKRREKSMRQE